MKLHWADVLLLAVALILTVATVCYVMWEDSLLAPLY